MLIERAKAATASIKAAAAVVIKDKWKARSYLVLGNAPPISQPKRPTEEKEATERDLGGVLVPPGCDVSLVAYKEGPFTVVLHVEVIVDGDARVLARVGFSHLIDKGLVLLGGEVVARKEVEYHLNLDDWIRA